MPDQPDPRTNVIFILADDQGPWAMGCAGNHEIRTPHLDRLAATGTRFSNFFCATPVCSPSRATFLTGRIPSQHGIHDYLSGRRCGPDSLPYIRDEIAYTDIMARNGWTCAISGKWHMGDNWSPQHGFSHWFVRQNDGGPYTRADMIRNGEFVLEERYVTNVCTDEALMLIDRYADRDQPFYLSVHYNNPHSPYTGHPQDIVDSYDDCPFETCPQEPIHEWARHPRHQLTHQCLGNREMLKGYFAAVTAMDLDIGRIIDKVEARGLREKTLIVFVSDNGFSCGHHGFWGKGNGTGPRNMYENSVKVPAIFSHPGAIPEGRVEDAMVSAYDFMPTLLAYVDLPCPTEEQNLPGRSFLPLLRGEPMDARECVVIYDEYGPVRMVRTKDWKFVYRHSHGPHELYDLVNDPDERRNLADDPRQEGRIAEMKAMMEEWFAQYVIPEIDGLRQDGTKHGQDRLAVYA